MIKRLWILAIAACLLTACGSRKYSPNKAATASATADAMAALSNKDLYNFITEWAGVQYRLGGLDKRGIDCSGFALLLEKKIYGVNLPRRSRDQAEVIKKKSMGQLKEGDLIFFSFGGREVDHVGIYLNGDYFVHASPTRGVIVDNLTIGAYQKALVKAGPVNN